MSKNHKKITRAQKIARAQAEMQQIPIRIEAAKQEREKKIRAAVHKLNALESARAVWDNFQSGDWSLGDEVDASYDPSERLEVLEDQISAIPHDIVEEARDRIKAQRQAQINADEEIRLAKKNRHVEKDLIDDVLGRNIPLTDYCSENYSRWERDIATPALEKLGYKHITFVDGERDSFGPLSRIARCVNDGVYYELIYG